MDNFAKIMAKSLVLMVIVNAIANLVSLEIFAKHNCKLALEVPTHKHVKMVEQHQEILFHRIVNALVLQDSKEIIVRLLLLVQLGQMEILV